MEVRTVSAAFWVCRNRASRACHRHHAWPPPFSLPPACRIITSSRSRPVSTHPRRVAPSGVRFHQHSSPLSGAGCKDLRRQLTRGSIWFTCVGGLSPYRPSHWSTYQTPPYQLPSVSGAPPSCPSRSLKSGSPAPPPLPPPPALGYLGFPAMRPRVNRHLLPGPIRRQGAWCSSPVGGRRGPLLDKISRVRRFVRSRSERGLKSGHTTET